MAAVLSLGNVYGTPVFTLTGIVADLSAIYGGVFNGKAKQWLFPAFYPVHTIVLSDLKKTIPQIIVSEEAQAHVASLDSYTFPADFTFITEPFAHQREGLEHIHRYLRAGLFYDPGLGKCKITVDLQRLTGDPMLILCPKIMTTTWAEEFVKHGNITNTVALIGTKKNKIKLIEAAIKATPAAFITTYETAKLYHEDILKINYKCIVADESHNLKSAFAERTKAATALAARAYRRILLSGTPSVGSPFDLYGQLRFLGKYFCSENWWKFRKLFGVFPEFEKDEAVPKIVLGFKNWPLINERVNRVCRRKTKEECLDLPERQIIDVLFNLEGAHKKEYNSFIDANADPVGYGVLKQLEQNTLNHTSGVRLPQYATAVETITLLGKLDQLGSGFWYTTSVNPALCNGCSNVTTCVDEGVTPYTSRCSVVQKKPDNEVHLAAGNTRLEICKDLLETLIENPQNKIIIWGVYVEELNQLENMVKELALPYVRVQGGMSAKALETARNTFNNDPKCRIYLGQASMGIGVTLNAANYMIYYNLPWALQHYLQSLDRNFRVGQDKKTTVYRLLARHTLDIAKAVAMDQKIDFSKLVVSQDICATCSNFATRCAKFKIKPFEAECIHPPEIARKVMKVSKIP